MRRALWWIPLLVVGLVTAACCCRTVCCPDATRVVHVSEAPVVHLSETAPTEPEVAAADPLLWMVRGEPRVFLFGTIHVANAEVKEQSAVERIAFDQSDTVFTEIMMEEGMAMEVAAAIQEHGMLPQGTTLSDLMDEATLATTKQLLGALIPLEALSGFKPGIVQLMVLQVALQKHQTETGAEGPVLDMKIAADARAAGKTTLALETAADQVMALVALSIEDQCEMLKRTVEQFAEAESMGTDMLATMLEAYQSGDPEILANMPGDDEITVKFMRAINDERNAGMTDGIVAWMEAHPNGCAWVAVGALHMPGENGIVERLRRKGHDVVRVRLGDLELVKPREPAK